MRSPRALVERKRKDSPPSAETGEVTHWHFRFDRATTGYVDERSELSKADVGIGKIRKLYAVEQKIQAFPPEEKTRQCQQLAQPALDDLKPWLEQNSTRAPKGSLIETAKANGQEPLGYLAHVSRHIGDAKTLEQIEALLPWQHERTAKRE